MVTICCVCQKTKTEGGWILQSLPKEAVPSHGYCPECAEKAMREIREFQHALRELPALAEVS